MVKGVCLLALVRRVVSSAFHCLYLALQEHRSPGREAVCLNRRLPLIEKSLWLQTIVSACVCHLSVHSKDGFQGFIQGGGDIALNLYMRCLAFLIRARRLTFHRWQ